MCYSIPGKVVDIEDGTVTLDYFGETKKARNEFYGLTAGDYVYAQGGLVVQKVPSDEAGPILETWREIFFKLQEVDSRMAREAGNPHREANSIRQRQLGNSACVHGIIEFSNHCRSHCLYCGLRKDNRSLKRYRMGVDEIVDACGVAVREMNFKAMVLQSGEDAWYTQDRLARVVERIMEEHPILLTLSIGERAAETYRALYEAGARAVLMRFETGNPSLYEKVRPGRKLEERLELLNRLQGIGYLIMTGFLIGLPGQTEADILNDIQLTRSLNAEMFSIGPFIPHPETPLANSRSPSLDSVLATIARARTLCPDAKILVTTALETLDKENGARRGLLSGANSLMINATPGEYRKLYELYPDRAGADEDTPARVGKVLELLHSLGRAPTDIGV